MVAAAMINTAPTTPPMVAPLSEHVVSVFSAWRISDTVGTKTWGKKQLAVAHLLVETSMGVLSVVPATLVADTVSV